MLKIIRNKRTLVLGNWNRVSISVPRMGIGEDYYLSILSTGYFCYFRPEPVESRTGDQNWGLTSVPGIWIRELGSTTTVDSRYQLLSARTGGIEIRDQPSTSIEYFWYRYCCGYQISENRFPNSKWFVNVNLVIVELDKNNTCVSSINITLVLCNRLQP